MMISGFTQETFFPCLGMGNVLTLYFLVIGLVFYRTLMRIESVQTETKHNASTVYEKP